MSNFEIAKRIIKENIEQANCGLFNTRNVVGDHMVNIYDNNGLIIDICYDWAYFEVFGLSQDEFDNLKDYYEELLQ